MSKVLEHIINKFIAEQFWKQKKDNTNKSTDPICAMIKQTDSKNIIKVGKPGTNQPGGQIQAQTALSSEKAAAIKNGAVDAFIIVTCLQTGNKMPGNTMDVMITNLLSNISNIPFMQQYTTTTHFGLISNLYTTRADDSMIIPVWIFKGTVRDYVEKLMTIKDNVIQTPRGPIEILNELLKYITTNQFTVGRIKNPEPNTNPPDPNYKEFIPLSLKLKDIDESLYNKYLTQITNNTSITFNADKTSIINTTLNNKQIEKFVIKLADNIVYDLKELYNNPNFKQTHPGWDESVFGLAAIRNTLKMTIFPKYEPSILVATGQVGELQFYRADVLLKQIKTAPVINQLNKFFKFN
jgi:hypothetical protein